MKSALLQTKPLALVLTPFFRQTLVPETSVPLVLSLEEVLYDKRLVKMCVP
jgi:hypothetical protein